MQCGSAEVSRGRRGAWRALLVVAGVAGGLFVMALEGCASPPSVTPLLRVAEEAARAEARRVEGDGVRDRAWLEGARRSLQAAYDADLSQRGSLTADWVRDATDVYVEAREALVRHEGVLDAERRNRASNMEAAADAIRRAAALLERQDALLTRAGGGAEVWKLMQLHAKEAAR